MKANLVFSYYDFNFRWMERHYLQSQALVRDYK
jgi:hypothetical protein